MGLADADAVAMVWLLDRLVMALTNWLTSLKGKVSANLRGHRCEHWRKLAIKNRLKAAKARCLVNRTILGGADWSDGKLYRVAGCQWHLLTVTGLFICVSGCCRNQRCKVARLQLLEAKFDGKTLPHRLLLTVSDFLCQTKARASISRHYLTAKC